MSEQPPAALPPPSQYVEDYFLHCFGFNERKLLYSEVQERFALEDGGTTLVSKANGRRFAAGSFACPTLGALRESGRQVAKQESGLAAPNSSRALPLVLRHVVTMESLSDHGNPEHRGALFQVASQFNCLEFTSSKKTPEDGIVGYGHDRTQGPACAIACAPATVFRNYFVPVPRPGGGSAVTQEPQIGQTGEWQLNTLDQVEALLGNLEMPVGDKGKFFWIENGYIFSDSQRLSRLNRKLDDMGEDGKDRVRAALRVGYARNSEVVFQDFVPFEGLVPLAGRAGPRQEVAQIFCAAANVNTSFAQRYEWEPFARLLLEATYEATLWAAVENYRASKLEATAQGCEVPPGSHRVMLTLVGGGVFGNELEWIVDAINRAIAVVAAEAGPSSRGLEVCISHFKEINPALEQAIRCDATRNALGEHWTCESCTCMNSELAGKCWACDARRPQEEPESSGDTL